MEATLQDLHIIIRIVSVEQTCTDLQSLGTPTNSKIQCACGKRSTVMSVSRGISVVAG